MPHKHDGMEMHKYVLFKFHTRGHAFRSEKLLFIFYRISALCGVREKKLWGVLTTV